MSGSSGCCGGWNCAGSDQKRDVSLKPANAVISVSVLYSFCMSVSGLIGPSVVRASFCICMSCCNMAIRSVSVPRPSAMFAVASIDAFQPRGSIGTKSLFKRTMRIASWFCTTKRRMPRNNVFMPVSAKIRAIISMCCCAADTVAATALAVEDCNASASSPAAAFEMPVRFCFTSSM